MTVEEERKKRRQYVRRMQDEILGEESTNLTEKQREERRKKLFNARKEYLGEEKSVNKIIPLVSVCIPTYQHKDFIEECLKRALMQQTTFSYEIIVCDDGSSDGTVEICRTYAEKHQDKIRLYDHIRYMTRLYDCTDDCNVVGSFSWWWTLESARGKYIALCEGDDYWTDLLKLQKQIDFLEANEEYSMCFHAAEIIDENGNISEKKPLLPVKERDYTGEEILYNWIVPTASVVFRKKYIEKLTSQMSKNQGYLFGDIVLFLTLVECGKVYCISANPMVAYRVHSGGITQTNNTSAKRIKHYQILKKDFKGRYARICEKLIIYTCHLVFMQNRVFTFKGIKHLPNEEIAGIPKNILYFAMLIERRDWLYRRIRALYEIFTTKAGWDRIFMKIKDLSKKQHITK
jgi:glycosyltransferase involved in cell wall biosynthesis